MKFSRIALATLLVAGLALTAAIAQQPNGQPQSPGAGHGNWQHHQPNSEEQIKHLTKALDLTADQQTQLKAIFADRDQQFAALRDDNTGDRKEKFAKFRSIRETTETKLQGILTDEQKQKYTDLKEKERQRMEERREQHQNGNAPASNPTPPSGL